jgi:tRNA pseudouridine38-40 synthase
MMPTSTTSRRPTSNEAVSSEPGRADPAGLVCAGARPDGGPAGEPASKPNGESDSELDPGQPLAPDLLRLRIDLSYDGSAFHGWATQPGLPTVQQTVEEALWRALALAEPPGLTVAGRTDAGVHARGQVAHADVPAASWTAAAGSAARRLARILPPEVRVAAIGRAPAGFDARFSALWRRYSYRVSDDPALADPLRRHDTLWYRRPLDLDRMNAAAAACLGEHDFAAFCRSRVGATTIRELLRLYWVRAEPGVAVATVTADAFCHNMVRALAGAMLSVGDGSRPPEWLGQVLAARQRDPAVRVAPPHPLCLEEVGYPEPAAMASRAVMTRRTRTLQTGNVAGLRASCT